MIETLRDREPLHYYGLRAFAHRIQVPEPTMRLWRATGRLPVEDVILDDRPGWSLETMDRFDSERRARG